MEERREGFGQLLSDVGYIRGICEGLDSKFADFMEDFDEHKKDDNHRLTSLEGSKKQIIAAIVGGGIVAVFINQGLTGIAKVVAAAIGL